MHPVPLVPVDQAINKPNITWKGNLSLVVFLDQNFMRNKSILGKKPKSWTHTPKMLLFKIGIEMHD